MMEASNYSLVFVLVTILVMINEGKTKSIDEMIMEAASYDSVEMLDLFHDMGDGQLMAIVDLDILLDMKQLAEYRSENSRVKRKAWSNTETRWSDRTVPYEIANDFSNRERNIIEAAINDWRNYTCLSFNEVRPDQRNQFPSRIMFRDGGGCYSRLGRTGSVQPISLARGCRTQGIVVHEIGHAIGWIHEQARPDRDDYITINFNQIPKDWRPQFKKVAASNINDFGVEYDYTSIMHYSANSFGSRTIVTRDPAFQNKLGQREGLSFRDIKIANLMYHCDQSNQQCSPMTCPGEGFQGKTCKCYCPTKTDDLSNPIELCDMTAPITTTPRPRPTTPRPTLPTVPTECRDLLGAENCKRIKDLNVCVSRPDKTMMYCRKTCGFCDDDVDKMCMDFDDACPFIASSGYCRNSTTFVDIVHATCPKSCKLCTPTSLPCGADISNANGNSGVGLYCNYVWMLVMIFITLRHLF